LLPKKNNAIQLENKNRKFFLHQQKNDRILSESNKQHKSRFVHKDNYTDGVKERANCKVLKIERKCINFTLHIANVFLPLSFLKCMHMKEEMETIEMNDEFFIIL
jgi:hypothetical protein